MGLRRQWQRGQLCLRDDEDRYKPELIVINGKGGDGDGNVHESAASTRCCSKSLVRSNAVGQLGLGDRDDGDGVETMMIHASLTLAEDDEDGGVVMYLTGSDECGQLCTNTGGEDVQNPCRSMLMNRWLYCSRPPRNRATFCTRTVALARADGTTLGNCATLRIPTRIWTGT